MLEIKSCRDPNHEDDGPLSAGDFYDSSPRVCRTCHNRRSAAQDKNHKLRIAAAKERLGITTSTKPDETAATHDAKLRNLEAKYAALKSQPERVPVQVSTANGWNGAIDYFLKAPQKIQTNGLRKLG